jgi:hypothetical protein
LKRHHDVPLLTPFFIYYYWRFKIQIKQFKTQRKLLTDTNTFGHKKIKVILDRGFLSAGNINDLYQHHMRFLIAAILSLKPVQRHLDPVQSVMRCRGPATTRISNSILICCQSHETMSRSVITLNPPSSLNILPPF